MLFGGSRLSVVGAVLLSLFPFAPASADSVIYYSPPESTFGWCAGYANSRAHRCAKDYCVKLGGTACGLAVECGGGWGAVAFAQDPQPGVGAVCGVNGADAARFIALASCMVASNALCWTSSAFSPNGNEVSKRSNREFDITWYSQAILAIRNYDVGVADGRDGPQTREAVKEFQRDIGREPTGTIDDELFHRLLDAMEGAQSLARKLNSDVLEPKREELGDLIYGHSTSPAPAATFSEELMTRSEDERRLALATILASGGTECTLPALEAYPLPDASSQIWNIECSEGSYTLILSEGSRIVINNGPAKSGGLDSRTSSNVAPSTGAAFAIAAAPPSCLRFCAFGRCRQRSSGSGSGRPSASSR